MTDSSLGGKEEGQFSAQPVGSCLSKQQVTIRVINISRFRWGQKIGIPTFFCPKSRRSYIGQENLAKYGRIL